MFMADFKIQLHPKQYQAYHSKARISAFIAGIQAGKSLCGALWMAKQVELHNRVGNFLITSPNYRILQQSILSIILKVFREIGTYRSSDSVINLHAGGQIFLRSMQDPDSCEGIPAVQAILNDEAGLLSYRAWANLLARTAFCKAQMFISSTPYSQNWMYRDLYVPWSKGQIRPEDLSIVICKSSDNPFFPAEELERQRALMDERIFRLKYEASFEKLTGLVYPDFDLVNNAIEPHMPRRDQYTFVAGIDPGFSDPTAIIVVAIHKEGKHAYCIAEYYKQFMSHSDRIAVLRDYHQRYGITQFYCDSSVPADIEMMNSAGLPVVACEKGAGSVMSGIGYVTSLIRDGRLRVMIKQCPNLVEEFGLYSYPENQLDCDDKNNEKPLSIHDHCFVAGTMVYTSKGSRPIESIRPGDLVLTRSGYQPVRCNMAHVSPVYEYLGLNGTSDHPIYTDRGFIPACELMPCDIYYRLEDIWSKLLNISARSITGIRIALIGLISLISGVAVIICTIWFILLQTARYLRDLLSTILMRILETIGLRTSSSCQEKITQAMLTQEKCYGSNRRRVWNTLRGFGRLLKNGMDLKRVTNGIKITLNKCVISCMQKYRISVSIVKRLTKPLMDIVDTVLMLASQQLVAKVVSIMLKGYAVSAEINTAPISINNQKHVPESAQVNYKAKIVYNLTVDNSPEYFANGILVHNCMDALRYVLVSSKGLLDKFTDTRFVPAKTHLEKLLAGEFEGSGPVIRDSEDWYNH
jgi:phage terminase large subunit